MKATRRWTREEDELLQQAIAKSSMSGPSPARPGDYVTVSSDSETGDDDAIIDWHSVASTIEGRNNKDCRKRWAYSLKPSIKKGSWNESEDKLLIKAVKLHGSRYTKLSSQTGNSSQSTGGSHCTAFMTGKLDNHVYVSENASGAIFFEYMQNSLLNAQPPSNGYTMNSITGSHWNGWQTDNYYICPSTDETLQQNSLTVHSLGSLQFSLPMTTDPGFVDNDSLNYRPGNRIFKYEMSISCQPPPVAQPNIELNPPLTALIRILDISTNEAIPIEEEPNSIWAMVFPVNEDNCDTVLSPSMCFFNRSTCDSVHPLKDNSGYVKFPYLSFNKEGLYRLRISLWKMDGEGGSCLMQVDSDPISVCHGEESLERVQISSYD
ncbi:hypothetical protein GP486_001966 [Trichoglossum hirsutum]|uniref:Myb-like domain-containing protein n=1 Tax=Trichoglossum hirsutum TaxID=265104 RepID=A0A9P8RS51_9PEZI|nr:hypothetical protein GP486_001966 [Trichoglossum hirsutum]